MPCVSPLSAWQSISKSSDGKSDILFKEPRGSLGSSYQAIQLPCSRCVTCRQRRSMEWAARCMHEAQLYPRNCFITLTYSPENLPDDMSLHVDHFQRFMKRLRKRFEGVSDVVDDNGIVSRPIRFFHCGEYGSLRGRPHYHSLLFNFDFPDKVRYRIHNGNLLYRSDALEELWPFGFSSIGECNFKSACYVASYIFKKRLGKDADSHYFDPSTGVFKSPEYVTMSRRPGIASRWFQRYSSDVYPRDGILVNGLLRRPPRYYDNLLKEFNPELWDDVDQSRQETMADYLLDPSPRPNLESIRINADAAVNRFPRKVD